jgi:nicotinate phosphoribosyltransferase
MAHSFVQAHRSEREAFEDFARARPHRPVMLVDTYDTEAAVAKVIDLYPKLAAEGIHLGGVRLDSGDLAAHAKAVRAMLDAAGLRQLIVFASGNLDEQRIARLLADGAPIDGFGVGTALDTSSDAPTLDAVYKLQSYAGVARRKRSEGKATWPGIKQAWRLLDAQGRFAGDRVGLADDAGDGEPLLQPVMRAGRRLPSTGTLAQARSRCAAQLARLPEALRTLEPAASPYPVEISHTLRALAREVDAATA